MVNQNWKPIFTWPELKIRTYSRKRKKPPETNATDQKIVHVAKKVKRKSRKRTAFDTNVTMSRAAKSITDVEDVNDRIEDHAVRRVLIFYYLLLIYYKEGVKVEKAQTIHQYGKAIEKNHHAAHSSILSNVKDNFADVLIESIRQNEITPKIEKRLSLMGFNNRQIKKVNSKKGKKDILDHLRREKTKHKRLFPDDAHFYKTMNSTVEVMREVNYFDKRIEGLLRQEAILLLNRTSIEQLHPYEGLKCFIDKMHEYFRISELQINQKMKLLPMVIQKQKECVRTEQEYIKAKTMSHKKEAFKEFLKALLALRRYCKKMEKKYFHYAPGFPRGSPLTYHETFIKKVFDRYFKEKIKVDKIKTLSGIKKYAKELDTVYQGKKGYLSKVSQATTLKNAKSAMNSFLFLCDMGELVFVLDDPKDWFGALDVHLALSGRGNAQSMMVLKKPFITALKVLKTQKEATVLPKYEILSGKLEEDIRVGLTEEELLKQKYSIMEYM